MSLNSVNEDLNDAFETYFPKLGSFKKCALRLMSHCIIVGLRLRRQLFKGKVLANERIVEYPQIFKWINPKGVVLDIGCVSSRLPIQLASLGYEVHGIDTRPYPYSHPNFRFFRADIFKWSPVNKYDIIIMISTLEHFGFGIYGDLVLPEADIEAVKRISDWLNKDGQLLVTVPFGKSGVTKKHRIYDLERLRLIFANFIWIDQKYFKRVKEAWLPSSAEELKNIASPKLPVNGVALLNLLKR